MVKTAVRPTLLRMPTILIGMEQNVHPLFLSVVSPLLLRRKVALFNLEQLPAMFLFHGVRILQQRSLLLIMILVPQGKIQALSQPLSVLMV